MRTSLSAQCNATVCATRCSGFTLVELVISIVLIGILASVGSSMIVDSFTTTRMVNAENASEGLARYALERLAREIREVKFVGSGATGNYSISTLTASKLVFTRTVSGADVTVTIDNLTAPTLLTLGYSLPAVTSNLSKNVSSFTLAYYDVLGNSTTDTSNSPGGIRFVVIALTVTADPTSGPSISQRTRVALRNAR